MNAPNANFEERIKYLWILIGCSTQDQFAERIEVDAKTVGRWMKAKKPPSLTGQKKIAAAFGVDLKDIHDYFKKGIPLPDPSDSNESNRIMSGASRPGFQQKLMDWFYRQSPPHQISVLEDIDEHECDSGKARPKDRSEQMGQPA